MLRLLLTKRSKSGISAVGDEMGRLLLPIHIKTSHQVLNRKTLPFGIRDYKDARLVAETLEAGEKKLIFDALRKSMADQYMEHKRLSKAIVHSDDVVALWHVYFIPHFVIGVLHSLNFIFLGEFLQNLGDYANLTAMGAAGLANVVANVALLNFSHHVEVFLIRFKIKRPILSADQAHTSEVRYVTLTAKMVGMLFGSLLGLAPLLFYDHPVNIRAKNGKIRIQQTIEQAWAQREEQNSGLIPPGISRCDLPPPLTGIHSNPAELKKEI